MPVDDRFLLPFLNPTSPGTNYWDPPPPGEITERQMGRVLLQIHQILGLIDQIGLDLKDKRFLDIGTGNGMIPRLLLTYTDLEQAVGADPFLNAEHKTSWQKHDEDEAFKRIRDLIAEVCPEIFNYDAYAELLGYEHHTLKPATVSSARQKAKEYRFSQTGAHDLEEMGEKFDLFYAKAIDHIPDWDGIFKSVNNVANEGSIFIIKHFSFFSYLGPHRYATTNIPWGHLLLTDDEYRRFAREFHAHRHEDMVKFYFSGLSYPRTTLGELTEMAYQNGFVLDLALNEPLRQARTFGKMVREVDDFWGLLRENNPGVSFDEMLSGRYHIVFRRL